MVRGSISMRSVDASRPVRARQRASGSQRLARKTLSLLLDFDHFPAGVMPAIRADAVRKVFLPAVGAGDQGVRGDGIVRPSAVPSSLRVFSLGKRWHSSLLVHLTIAPAAWAGFHIIAGGIGESRRAVFRADPSSMRRRGRPGWRGGPPVPMVLSGLASIDFTGEIALARLFPPPTGFRPGAILLPGGLG